MSSLKIEGVRSLFCVKPKGSLGKKKKWDSDFSKRSQMKALLDKSIPEFSVRLGGTTSVDVTKEGIDKAYGIRTR